MEFLGNETERRGTEESKSEKTVTGEWERTRGRCFTVDRKHYFHMYQEAGRSPGRFPRTFIVARIRTRNFLPPDFVMFDVGGKV